MNYDRSADILLSSGSFARLLFYLGIIQSRRITASYKSTYVYEELLFLFLFHVRVFPSLRIEQAVICSPPSTTKRFDHEMAG